MQDLDNYKLNTKLDVKNIYNNYSGKYTILFGTIGGVIFLFVVGGACYKYQTKSRFTDGDEFY
jgi:hypothetical protein